MDVDDDNSTSTAPQRDKKRAGEFADQAHLIHGVLGIRQFGFPNKIITKIRYAFNITSGTLTNTVIADNVFRMASIYDPDLTGIGHQPMWHDEYQSLYEKYRVLGSELHATFAPSVYSYNGNYGPWVVGITGSRTSTSAVGYSNVQHLMESNDTSWGTLTPNVVAGSVNLFLDYSPSTKLSEEPTETDVSASFGSNPTADYYAHVWVCMTNAAATPATNAVVTIHGYIDYTVECYGLINPNGS